MNCRSQMSPILCLILLCCAGAVFAGWWDDLKEAVSEGAEVVKEKASHGLEVARQGLDSARTAVVESDAHAWVQEKLIQKAIPSIKEKVGDVKSWIHEKTAPDQQEGGNGKYTVLEVDEDEGR